MFDARFDVFEIVRVLVVDAVGIAYRDTNLPHAAQALDDQSPMSIVKGLITANQRVPSAASGQTPGAAAPSPVRPNIPARRSW
jgi:hypothetical protein